MKIKKFLTAALVIIILFPTLATAQSKVLRNVRVSVLPLWYAEDDSIGPVLSDAVQTSIQWTLRFIEGYVLVESKNYPEGQSGIAQFASSNRLDNVIYGRVDNIDGRYSISLLLLDVNKDRVEVMEQGFVTRSIEIFKLADSLSIILLEKFLGRKLEFGSIAMTPKGNGPGKTRLYVNGTLFGEDISDIPSFLSGDYEFRIERINGRDKLIVFDNVVTIKPGTINRIEFPMERYGYATFSKTGTDTKGSYLLNGKPYALPRSIHNPLAVGDYILVREQEGQPTYRTAFTITEGKVTDILVNTGNPGGALTVTYLGEGKAELLIDGMPSKSDIPAGTLAAGLHLVEVKQVFDRETITIYRKTARVPDNRQKVKSVSVTLHPDRDTAAAAGAKLRDPEFSLPPTQLSVEIQALGSAYIWAGGRFVTFNRKLGVSLLAGFSVLDRGDFVLCAEAKAHWIIGEREGIEPYAGIAGLMFTDFGTGNSLSEWQGGEYADPLFYIGPQIGISWNTRRPILTSIYSETTFCIPLDEISSPGLRWTLGLRLF